MMILSSVSLGLVSTTMMVLAMEAIHHLGWAKADMVQAIGSLITKKREGSFGLGLAIHYGVGVVIACGYNFILGIQASLDLRSILCLSTVLGLVHGVVVGLILTIEVAEHHPVKAYQRAGFGVVVSHIVGHVVYGFFVGLTYALFQGDFQSTGSILPTAAIDFLGFMVMWLVVYGAMILPPIAVVLWETYSLLMATTKK